MASVDIGCYRERAQLSWLHSATKILRNEGFLRFWRGYPAYFVRVSVMAFALGHLLRGSTLAGSQWWRLQCCPHGLIILVSREYIIQSYDSFFQLS
jgi:hypothetical protein